MPGQYITSLALSDIPDTPQCPLWRISAARRLRVFGTTTLVPTITTLSTQVRSSLFGKNSSRFPGHSVLSPDMPPAIIFRKSIMTSSPLDSRSSVFQDIASKPLPPMLHSPAKAQLLMDSSKSSVQMSIVLHLFTPEVSPTGLRDVASAILCNTPGTCTTLKLHLRVFSLKFRILGLSISPSSLSPRIFSNGL